MAAHEYAADGSELTPLELFSFFVNRCRKNLHIIIAFSPIGDAFRNHIRQYPSLINCCSIDWFDVSIEFMLRASLRFNEIMKLLNLIEVTDTDTFITIKQQMCMNRQINSTMKVA